MKIIYVFIFCSWFCSFAQYNSTQPNENTPVKFIKVLVHFINYRDGLRSISEANGKVAAVNYIKAANLQLANFSPISLKYNGQQLPTLPTKYRYVIAPIVNDVDDPDSDGIYFHTYANTHKPDLNDSTKSSEVHTIFNSLAKNKEIVNLFFVDGIASGIASLGMNKDFPALCTVSFPFLESEMNSGTIMTINHEIGHLLGRNHTWGYSYGCNSFIEFTDGCEDTPPNHNCNSLGVPNGNQTRLCPAIAFSQCDTPDEVTNNLMDYGQIYNNVSLTPCQLNSIHNFLNFNNYFLTNSVKECNITNNLILKNSILMNDYTANTITVEGNSSISFQNKSSILFESRVIILKSGFNVSSTEINQTFLTKSKTFNCPTNWELNSDENTWDEKHKDYFGVKNTNSNIRSENISFSGFACGYLQEISTNLGSNLRKSIDEEVSDKKVTNDIFVKDIIKFSITPNPSFGEFTINNLSLVPYEIEVFNTSGSLVFKESHVNGNSKINLHQSGVFIVKIFAENQVFIHKIINYESD